MNICDDCRAKWEDDEVVPLHRVRHLFERVDEGGPMPSGECPACGALTYGEEVYDSFERMDAAIEMARVIINEYEYNGCNTMYGPVIDFLYDNARKVVGAI